MLRTLRSPALLVAIIALVAATAGTATAASKILIKSSSQVRAGALDASDLSANARKSLKGNAGPAGAAGAPGPAGPAGARGPSEVFAAVSSGLNAPDCPAGGCADGAVLRTLALPAGSFLVTASTELAPVTFVANASHSVECHLRRSDSDAFQRTLHLYRAPAVSAVNDQTVEISWTLTLAAPASVRLECGVGDVKFGAANSRITAVQVGSLTETVS